MTTARDELVDVIAEAVEKEMRGAGLSDRPAEFDSSIHSWRCEYPDIYGPCDCFQTMKADTADAVLAALVERYGEPEIEDISNSWVDGVRMKRKTIRRLVFPWQAVKEGDQG